MIALRMVASCRQLQSCEIQNSAKTAIKAAGKVNIPSLFQSPCFFFFSPFVYIGVVLQTQTYYRLTQCWCNGFQFHCSELLSVPLPVAPAYVAWPISNTWLDLVSVIVDVKTHQYISVLRSVKSKKRIVPVCLQKRLRLWTSACQTVGYDLIRCTRRCIYQM